jgi:hypothetical protein
MKKLLILLIGLVFCSEAVGSTHSHLFTEIFLGSETDSDRFYIVIKEQNEGSASGFGDKAIFNFNLTGKGGKAWSEDTINDEIVDPKVGPTKNEKTFDPALYDVTGAHMKFWLSDWDISLEKVRIKANVQDSNASQIIWNKKYDLNASAPFAEIEIDLGPSGENLLDQLADGKLRTFSFALVAPSSDLPEGVADFSNFYIDKAELTVDAVSTPLPSAAILLMSALGFIGLGKFRKKKAL